jgi:uncharacterized protein YndB with AHSA1/START domain
MQNNFVSKASATINAPMAKVWQALTDPKMVKEWLFGTDMHVSNWEVGGEITYTGQWEGKSYQDKGKIVEIVPEQKLVSTYWSSFSGLPDAPENYQKVTYQLSQDGDGTKIEITQEGSKTEEQAKHSEGNWRQVLGSMKKILEK